MRKLLQLMFGSQFDEPLMINVRAPEYFKKLGVLMRLAKRQYVMRQSYHLVNDKHLVWVTLSSVI